MKARPVYLHPSILAMLRAIVVALLLLLIQGCREKNKYSVEIAELKEEIGKTTSQLEALPQYKQLEEQALQTLKMRQRDPEQSVEITFEERARKLKAEIAAATTVKDALQTQVNQLRKDMDSYRSKYQP